MGYGVETGLLIDLHERFGVASLAQVDCDRRVHRNQRLAALGRISFAIVHTFFARLQEQGIVSPDIDIPKELGLVSGRGEKVFLEEGGVSAG